MGLANFLDKAALAATQVLPGVDRRAFEEILLAHPVRLAFDENSLSREGLATLDLAVRLLARMYPRLQLVELDNPAGALATELMELARSINPHIDLRTNQAPAVCLVIGHTKVDYPVPTFYLGSDGWISGFSPEAPIGSGKSNNPFGAGVTACFGAANVFRTIFADQLPGSAPDEAFLLSTLTFERRSYVNAPADIPPINLEEMHLVGLGAVGNGTIWALAQLPHLHGHLHLVDGENTELFNLQRNIIARQQDIGVEKVKTIAHFLQPTNIQIHIHDQHWNTYLTQHSDWPLERVALGLDSDEVPQAFQSTLAGIMLASELICDAGNLQLSSLPASTGITRLRPLQKTPAESEDKHSAAPRISQDEVLLQGYHHEWARKVKPKEGQKQVCA